MTRYLLDTNIVSALIRDPQGPVTDRLQEIGEDNACTSIIVAAEVRYGIERRRSARLTARVEAVLARLKIEGFDSPADVIYGQLRARLERERHPIGAHDLLIATHALALDCIIVTDNVRKFARVPGLDCENWLRAPN